jgi:fucose permease
MLLLLLLFELNEGPSALTGTKSTNPRHVTSHALKNMLKSKVVTWPFLLFSFYIGTACSPCSFSYLKSNDFSEKLSSEIRISRGISTFLSSYINDMNLVYFLTLMNCYFLFLVMFIDDMQWLNYWPWTRRWLVNMYLSNTSWILCLFWLKERCKSDRQVFFQEISLIGR